MARFRCLSGAAPGPATLARKLHRTEYQRISCALKTTGGVKMIRSLLITLIMGFSMLFVACEQESAGERFAENVEEVGDEIRDSADNIGNEVEDACEEMKQEAGADDTDC